MASVTTGQDQETKIWGSSTDKATGCVTLISVHELQHAETEILKYVQEQSFKEAKQTSNPHVKK